MRRRRSRWRVPMARGACYARTRSCCAAGWRHASCWARQRRDTPGSLLRMGRPLGGATTCAPGRPGRTAQLGSGLLHALRRSASAIEGHSRGSSFFFFWLCQGRSTLRRSASQAWLPLVAMRGFSLDLRPGAAAHGAAGAADVAGEPGEPVPHVSVSDFSNEIHVQIVPLGAGRVRLVAFQA